MLDYSQIQALLAVENEGTFEGAARSLRITSFAVTQRIKLLEKSLGVQLIERKPTRTSEAGKVLCEHAREVIALEIAVIDQPQLDCQEQHGDRRTLKIALNDESISSWFGQVLKDQSQRKDGVRFDVTLTNCDCANDLMQSGKVTAAVSSRKEPVHGFKSYTLAPATYLPVASPTFIDRHFPDGVSKTNLGSAPCLRFCNNDNCAFEWTKQVFGEALQLTLFKHPSTASLISNCLNHLAWALAPEPLVHNHINTGALVELLPNHPLKKPLYWHVSGDMVDELIHVTRSIKNAAA